MSRLLNAFQMIDILSVRSVVSVSELAERLSLSERGVQRLKDDLLDAGYEIQTIFGPNGGYQMMTRSKISPRNFSEAEMSQIQRGLSHLIQSSGNVFEDNFTQTIGKLANHIDVYGLSQITSIQSIKLNINAETYQAHIRSIERAINNNRRVTIEYAPTPFNQKQYKIEPYELVLMNQFWYMLGYDEVGRYLTLKVNRISSLELSDEIFRKDEHTHSSEKISEFGFKLSPVQFHGKIANRSDISEFIWGKNQEIIWIDEKEFEIKVEFSNLKAAESFVMQIGSNIQIISPLFLKEWMKEEANKILLVNG